MNESGLDEKLRLSINPDIGDEAPDSLQGSSGTHNMIVGRQRASQPPHARPIGNGPYTPAGVPARVIASLRLGTVKAIWSQHGWYGLQFVTNSANLNQTLDNEKPAPRRIGQAVRVESP